MKLEIWFENLNNAMATEVKFTNYSFIIIFLVNITLTENILKNITIQKNSV